MDPATRLDRARRVATLLDSAVTLPVVGRIGLDGIVGLLPVAGDWVTAAVGLYIVYQGYRLGLPRRTIAKMMLVVAADAVVGSIPLVGDLLDIVWRSAERIVATIERHVEPSG